MRRGFIGALVVPLALSIAACATVREVAPNPALFAHGAAVACEEPGSGRVALFVPEGVRDTMGQPETYLRVQVGEIAAQAVLVALRECFKGGGQEVTEPPPADGSYPATLVINAVRYEHKDRLLWFIPTGFLTAIGQREFSSKVTVDLTLLDTDGHTVWTRSFADDGGRLTWTSPSIGGEPLFDGIVRLSHEAAWRVAQRAAQDLREWTDVQRLQPREL